MRAATLIKKFAIVCHRWMGVVFCLLFTWWFLSGIFMMYWDYPDVSRADRLEHAQDIDVSKIRISPQEAWTDKGRPDGLTLAMLDGRPVYRFISGLEAKLIYADNGEPQADYPEPLLLRLAADWAARPPSSAIAQEITQPDQWTIGLRDSLPLLKYSFPDGQQIYISKDSGDVLQYTTRASRIGAWLGPIPHWLYFTSLRLHQELWTNLIIYTSLTATLVALLGLIVGIWMYSPTKKYRPEGFVTGIPYTGQKRLHMLLGLFFGIVACTWSFSGMLSMDPPFLSSSDDAATRRTGQSASARIQATLHPGRFRLSAYDARTPQQAVAQLSGLHVKELEFTSFDGQAVYIAAIGPRETRIVPLAGGAQMEFNRNRILQMVANAARPTPVTEQRVMTEYDSYYLDRHHALPLPVLFVKLADPEHTQLYIDPRRARTVEQHTDDDSFIARWLYHGLHSLNFPWLYNHGPAWDIVVLTLMLGGLAVSVTSVILAWQLLRKKLTGAQTQIRSAT